MNDLISRSALVDEFRARKMTDAVPDYDRATVDVKDALYQYAQLTKGLLFAAPAVDAEVVRHGRWIVKCETHGDPYDDGQWEEWMALCSECGRVICLDDFECAKGNVGKEIAKFPYCHCGCKMDGAENDV